VNYKWVVFDHDHGKLENLAKEAGFHVLDVDNDDEEVVSLSSSSWKLAFVHIGKDQWRELCESISDERVMVGFSSQGFPPTFPEGKHMLALRCLKKTSDLREADISTLAAVCSREGAVREFRSGHIPRSVHTLIAFVEPHRLRALHILLQGALALWASDAGNPDYQEASKLLGVTSIPGLATKEIVHMKVLWKGLGLPADPVISSESKKVFREGVLQELGSEGFSGAPEVEKLLRHILGSKENEDIDSRIALSGFKEIDKFLCGP
jgi:hypothetical protein